MSDDGKRLEYELLKLAYTEAMHGRWLWVADRSEVEVTGEDVAAAERTLDAFVDAHPSARGAGAGRVAAGSQGALR